MANRFAAQHGLDVLPSTTLQGERAFSVAEDTGFEPCYIATVGPAPEYAVAPATPPRRAAAATAAAAAAAAAPPTYIAPTNRPVSYLEPRPMYAVADERDDPVYAAAPVAPASRPPTRPVANNAAANAANAAAAAPTAPLPVPSLLPSYTDAEQGIPVDPDLGEHLPDFWGKVVAANAGPRGRAHRRRPRARARGRGGEQKSG
jgi:hypothetical protein